MLSVKFLSSKDMEVFWDRQRQLCGDPWDGAKMLAPVVGLLLEISNSNTVNEKLSSLKEIKIKT
jgi:hypothetical protein